MSKKIATLSAILLGAFVAASPAKAEYNLTLCGASPGGLWSLLGSGIDAAVKESYPGSVVTYQTSGGGFANIALLGQNKCDLAIVHDAEAAVAKQGGKPFNAPIENIRTIAVLYTWAPMQMIMNADFAKEHGVNSIEDIAVKKVPVRVLLNKRGNVASQVGADMLTAAGASPEDIESWGGSVTYAASKEQGELMRDRRADVILNSLFVNHRSIRQLADAIDLKLLDATGNTLGEVSDKWSIGTYMIPADAYKWKEGDTETVTLSAQLFVRDDADPKMVEEITAALVKNADKIQGVHKAMKPLTTKLMADGKAIEYHPAAASVYKAEGLQ
jgi:TRAP transporter TAXI family solute receptor